MTTQRIDGHSLQLATRFLRIIFSGTTNQIEFRALPSRKRIFTRDPKTARGFVKNNSGQNIYFGVATRKWKRGDKSACRELTVLWVDIDYKITPAEEAAKFIKASPWPPSFIVSSGGGLHLYWLLREPIKCEPRVEQVLKGLAAALHGDHAVAEIARVMRLPGTFNQKYTPPRQCLIQEEHLERTYSLNDFKSLVGSVAQLRTKKTAIRRAKNDLPSGVSEGGRNTTAVRLAGEYLHRGLTAGETLVQLRSWNSTNTPPLADSEVEGIVASISKAEDRKREQGGHGAQANVLVDLVEQAGVELFHDQFNRPWASIGHGESIENVQLEGKQFHYLVARICWKAYRKAPSSEAVRSAVNVLAAKAIHEGQIHPLNVRCAWYQDALWYDLNPHAVRIDAGGWEVVTRPPIIFQRFAGHQPQVIPERGGDFKEVLKFANLRGNVLKGPRLLFLVHVATFLFSDIARPIFVLTGNKGSAKTTLARIVQRIVDPNSRDVLSFPDSEREFVQALAHQHCTVFDNLGTLPKWGSDALSRSVTGAGFGKRALYSDDDDFLYSFKRAIVLTGIWNVASKSDLLDRCIIYELPEITQHLEEKQFWADFEKERPFLLGALFDTLSAAMRVRPGLVGASSNTRMADFGGWGAAIAQAMGASDEDFVSALADNSEMVRFEAINSSPVGICLVKFLRRRKRGWVGSATKLLAGLKRIAPKAGVDDKSLPRDASWCARLVKELATDLKVAGWKITIAHSGKREIRFSPLPSKQSNPRCITGQKAKNVNVSAKSKRSRGASPAKLDTMDATDTISVQSEGPIVASRERPDCEVEDGALEEVY